MNQQDKEWIESEADKYSSQKDAAFAYPESYNAFIAGATAASTRAVEVKLENEELKGKNNPYPFKDVLNKLIWATEFLLHKKDYDGPNYEELNICVKRGKEIEQLLNK